MWQEILQLFLVMIVFLGVLFLTYYVTKKIAAVNKGMSHNKNMEIIEVLPLNQGQYLYIIRAGEKFFLLGVSQKGNMTYISELDQDKLKTDDKKVISFQAQFKQLMKGRQVKEDENKE